MFNRIETYLQRREQAAHFAAFFLLRAQVDGLNWWKRALIHHRAFRGELARLSKPRAACLFLV